jgi:hypothetical protein
MNKKLRNNMNREKHIQIQIIHHIDKKTKDNMPEAVRKKKNTIYKWW